MTRCGTVSSRGIGPVSGILRIGLLSRGSSACFAGRRSGIARPSSRGAKVRCNRCRRQHRSLSSRVWRRSSASYGASVRTFGAGPLPSGRRAGCARASAAPRPRKVLIRVQGPTTDDEDDELLEAKEVANLDGVSCLAEPTTTPALRVVDGTRQLGRLKHDILAVGPTLLIPAAADRAEHWLNWWVSSWEASYREVRLDDLRSVEDLADIVYDSGVQLGAGDPTDASARKQPLSPVLKLRIECGRKPPPSSRSFSRGWRELGAR